MEERLYDLIFIFRPDTPEPEIDKVIATIEHAASEKGDKVEKTENGAGAAWPTGCSGCGKDSTCTW